MYLDVTSRSKWVGEPDYLTIPNNHKPCKYWNISQFLTWKFSLICRLHKRIIGMHCCLDSDTAVHLLQWRCPTPPFVPPPPPFSITTQPPTELVVRASFAIAVKSWNCSAKFCKRPQIWLCGFWRQLWAANGLLLSLSLQMIDLGRESGSVSLVFFVTGKSCASCVGIQRTSGFEKSWQVLLWFHLKFERQINPTPLFLQMLICITFKLW